ncbi:HAD hydrolase-like protein [Asticcacaulis sp. 201]|uniref:HAD hydrolase-like protein n=1 Tax=Asticcacaulis sp. 201 TaxID=3028787 RepID=UPI0029169510|nr:HAD hydrolase-like protein [Asticcacaulis sp. 201]MDV6329722.1 HAD hydrolase-like protein [Asticcacaulis sp. 201]
MTLDGYIIAFDLDGTLVDTAPDIIGALNKVLIEEGVKPFHLDEARPMIGRGAMELLRRAFALAGQPLAAEQEKPLLQRLLTLYEQHIDELSRPYDGMVAALDVLEAAGARFAVCTNKHNYLAVELIRRLNLSHRFGSIKGADVVPNKKPAAGHLRACVDEMQGDMARTIMVGDSETDFLTARAADVPCILFTFGYSERPLSELTPNALLDHYRDLPAAVASCLTTRA